MGDQCMEPMPLDEYMDKTMATLQGADAKDLGEVATGFADMGVVRRGPILGWCRRG